MSGDMRQFCQIMSRNWNVWRVWKNVGCRRINRDRGIDTDSGADQQAPGDDESARRRLRFMDSKLRAFSII